MDGGKGIQGLCGGSPEAGKGALRALPQEGFKFGESQFDRVEVRAVGREVKQSGSAVFDRLTHSADLVGGEVVADDEIVAVEFG